MIECKNILSEFCSQNQFSFAVDIFFTASLVEAHFSWLRKMFIKTTQICELFMLDSSKSCSPFCQKGKSILELKMDGIYQTLKDLAKTQC